MVIENEIMICSQPEFEPCKKLDASVDYFVVCKKNQSVIGALDAYETKIAGEKIVDWVARACENAKILEINEYANELQAVLPYLGNAEYTVILKGNIPLLTKQHLRDILHYIMLKNMNACKLKGGYVFKTEYLKDVGEVLSADTYNMKTYDFFEVVGFESFEFARKEIMKRIFGYHFKNGIFIECLNSCQIDANVQIEYGCKISNNTCILSESKLCQYSNVGKNSIISESMIKSDCVIGDNVIIKNSIVGANVKIGDGVVIENSKIFDGCEILTATRVLNSQIGVGVKVKELCDIAESKVGNNAVVGSMSRLLRANIEENYEVFDGKVLIQRVEEG